MQQNYLILGQGLAGSMLAWRLINAGEQVLVLDNAHRSSSSTVAAGLINPLAGMRFSRPEFTEQWLKSALSLYKEFADIFDIEVYVKKDMARLFRSEKQKKFYQRQIECPGSEQFLGETFEDLTNIQTPHGGFDQFNTGYIHTRPLLEALKQWLIKQDAYREVHIDYSDIQTIGDRIKIKEYEADHLIFCEGYKAMHNPWFDHLPYTPDKGEMFTLEGSLSIPDKIINGPHWIVPLGENRYRFGSTHEHTRLNEIPDADKTEEMHAGLAALVDTHDQVQVAGHIAGVRPATRDRMPLLGSHSQYPQLHIFNGFGARGSMTIPWYSQAFSQHLLKNIEIPQEADIKRFL